MTIATIADAVAAGRRTAGQGPWPCVELDAAAWREVADRLADGNFTLLGLWADGDTVHLAARGETVAVFSIVAVDGSYPSVAGTHLPAMRLERSLRDLFGLHPEGLPDERPWLDHGAWGVASPLHNAHPPSPPAEYRFLPVEGEDLHEIPVGPVHAGIIEPGHFRFTADGETVVRLEQRLGYTHKGVESLLSGSDIAHAARLAGRVSGDSTVAYAFAFARAVEVAAGITPPPRAILLRGLMAELERIANHLGDIGAICNDASFAIINAHFGILRERVLRTSAACFGHRLMMDRIVPGGVAVDLPPDGAAHVRDLLREIRARLPHLIELYDDTASLQDRTVGTGVVHAELARRFGAGGPIGRASGRDFDTRRDLAYPPYDTLNFTVPVRTQGDVNARIWLRIGELGESMALIDQILGRLQAGAIRAPETSCADAGGREGIAMVESFRGDVLAWVRLDNDGRIARCHLRDPSWFQWPLLEAAIEGNIVADFPLCNKSFNCSYSGQDL
jgi:Ni,Fe-hydrogenase III large subunit